MDTKKIISSVLILIVILINTLGCSQVTPLSKLEILKLVDSSEYNKVINYYDKINIYELGPYDLIYLCNAVNQTGGNIDDYINGTSPKEKFLKIYFNVISGHIESSLKSFQLFVEDNNEKLAYYGIIGIIETYLFTEDYNSLMNFIENAEKKWAANNEIINTINFYKIIIYDRVHDFNSLEHEIRKFDTATLEGDIDFQIIKIKLLIRKNSLGQALAEVDKILNKTGPLQDLILLKYEIINLVNGKKAGKEFIDQYSIKNYWKVNLTNLSSRLYDSGKNERESAANEIVNIGIDRKKDIPTLLAICNILIDSGFTVRAASLSNHFYTNVKQPYYFFLSNLFYSKFHLSSGNDLIFQQYLDYAKKQNLSDENLLWFLYDISIKNDAYHNALGILDKLLERDQNNIELLANKGFVCKKLAKPDCLNFVNNKIISSNRFIPPEIEMKSKTGSW